MKKYYVYHIKRPGMELHEGYIGVTCDLHKRWEAHSRGDYHVGRAIRKYKDVQMKVLVACSEEYALDLEQKLRPQTNTGWNMAIGGGMPPSWKGKKHSKESLAKLSVANTKENNPMWGKTHSEEYKARLRSDQLGEGNPMFGKEITDEHRANLVADVKTCTHCGMTSRSGCIARWHNDNCKHKLGVNNES